MTQTPEPAGIDTEHLRDYSELRRSVTDRKIAGIAGGLGRHLNVDPTILRVAFVVICFFGGAGFLLYGALWLFVPKEGETNAVISTSPGTRNAILIIAGVLAALLLLGDSLGGLPFPWPLAIVAAIVAIILLNRDKPVNAQNPPPGPAPSPTETASVTPYDDTTTQQTPEYYSATPPPPWTPATGIPPYEPPPAAKPDRGPKLFWITVALIAVALGSLGLYDVAVGGVVEAAYPALALTVIGAMLVLGAWFGRAGGLILLGIFASIALLITSTVEPGFSGDRRLDARPLSAAAVQSVYSIPAGNIHLDLRGVSDLAALDGRQIDLDANAGEIVVILPREVDATVTADIAVAGDAYVVGERSEGTNVSIERDIDGGVDVPEINLNIDLGVGRIEVRQ